MLETNNWLKLIHEILDSKYDKDALILLIRESEELDGILGTIVKKTRR